MNNWIPVEERLPERGYWLVTTTGKEVMEAFYSGKSWRNRIDDIVPIIAWQPLPNPYQEPRRFVVGMVDGSLSLRPYYVMCTHGIVKVAQDIPTREAAQRIADVYEEVYR